MKPTSPWCCLVFLSSIVSIHASESEPSKPNIIYLVADELGYFEPGFMGGTTIATPNVDRMARQGLVFRNMLAGAPCCAPTRCCLMTGKHAGHTSVRINPGGTPLRPEEETIASILKTRGYATGGFGKWGIGGRGSTGVPEQHGFDLFLGYYDQVHAHTYYPPYLIQNSQEIPLEGNHGKSDGKTYSQYVIHGAAIQFIREHAKKPFFAYLPYTPPHGNFDIPDNDPAWALYKDQPWPEPARRYAAMVTMVDRQLGEILSLVRELGLEKNTLILFSGDNGGADYFKSEQSPRGIHSANKNSKAGTEYRGTKNTIYEGGLRIPFVAYWPGKIAPGRVTEFLGYIPDLMPTLAELSGASIPRDTDGISFVTELLGETVTGRKQAQHEYLYWEFNGQIAVRQEKWSAVRPKPSSEWELYDLSKDPSQSHNLATSNRSVLDKLIALAIEAHVPAREGTFTSLDLHKRDQRAKFGNHDMPDSPRNQK